MSELKQVIVVRADLKLPKGKLAAQVAHGAVQAAFNSDNEAVKKWILDGQKKVVLKVQNLEELLDIFKKAKNFGLKTALIKDAGRTFLEPGTITCVGIGPDEYSKINKVTGTLGMI